MTQTATKIEAIFDQDHGKQNEGWYARVQLSDGQERDIPFDARQSCGDATLTRKARAAAREDGWSVSRTCDVQISR